MIQECSTARHDVAVSGEISHFFYLDYFLAKAIVRSGAWLGYFARKKEVASKWMAKFVNDSLVNK